MAGPPTFQIVLIPGISATDARTDELAQKFRDFRLRSLREAPDAFASTYEAESQQGLDQSVMRITNPKAAQFIALRKPGPGTYSPQHNDDIERLLRYEWIGSIVLLGPEEESELSGPSANLGSFPQGDVFSRMTATARPAPISARDSESSLVAGELHFHINGTFVSHSARGAGLGNALMEAAMRRAEAEAKNKTSPLRVTLAVFSNNTAARHLYEKAGFRVLEIVPARSKPQFQAVRMEFNLGAVS